MLSVTFTSSGPLQDARSRTSGAARRTRSGVGSLQFWCPSSSTGGRLPEVPSHRMQLLHRGYLDESISKFQSLHCIVAHSEVFLQQHACNDNSLRDMSVPLSNCYYPPDLQKQTRWSKAIEEFADREDKASSGDNVQIPWQAMHFVTCDDTPHFTTLYPAHFTI